MIVKIRDYKPTGLIYNTLTSLMIIKTFSQMMSEYSFVTSTIFMDPFPKFQKMKLTPYPKECILIFTAYLYQKVFMRGYCYLKHGYVIACAVDVDGKQLRLQLNKDGQNCCDCVNAGDYNRTTVHVVTITCRCPSLKINTASNCNESEIVHLPYTSSA